MPAAKAPEFRRRAVELACLGEQPIAKIAKDLGISESCLRRWMEVDDVDAGRREGLTSTERAELVEVSAGRIGGGGRVGERGGRRGETSGAEWERGLGVLQAHVVAGGTATPATLLVVDGFALGRWVARRRELFRAGALQAERVAVLEAVPGWSWGRTQRDRFEEGLTHLRTYVTRHGIRDGDQSASPPHAPATHPGGRCPGRRRRRRRPPGRRGGAAASGVGAPAGPEPGACPGRGQDRQPAGQGRAAGEADRGPGGGRAADTRGGAARPRRGRGGGGGFPPGVPGHHRAGAGCGRGWWGRGPR